MIDLNTINTKTASILESFNVGQGNTKDLANTILRLSDTEIRFSMLARSLVFTSEAHKDAFLIMLLERLRKQNEKSFISLIDHITSSSESGLAFLSSNQKLEDSRVPMTDKFFDLVDLDSQFLSCGIYQVERAGRSRLLNVFSNDTKALRAICKSLGYSTTAIVDEEEEEIVGYKIDFPSSIFDALVGASK